MKISQRKFSRALALTLTLVMLVCSAFPPPSMLAQAQSKPQNPTQARSGLSVARFRPATGNEKKALQAQDDARPAWVSQALESSLTEIETQKAGYGLSDTAADLSLLSAEQDDLGQTHLRLAQLHQGVEVFGGQLVAHVKTGGSWAGAVAEVGGRTFDVSAVDTTPAVKEEQAVEAAKAAHKFTGEPASPPVARLVILPLSVLKNEQTSEAVLTWRVLLHIEGADEASGRFYYFINAQDGQLVWRQETARYGTGRSLYSGTVSVPSFWLGRYHMTDIGHGNSKVFDLNNAASGDGEHFTDDDDNWGDGTANNRQSAAVDVQFGVAKTWDYFQNVFSYRGMDGGGAAVTSKVHAGMNWGNAKNEAGTNHLYFGDGDGKPNGTTAFVSLDVVGHEFTHGVIDHTANLEYQHESGAINESFADIFGTAVEWQSGRNPDYRIGEDFSLSGGALRSMINPTVSRYSDRQNQGACVPQGDSTKPGYNDFCGVHTNSGIMNNAFYLLAEGGTHALSKIAVTGISRRKAEQIFWRALNYYLFPTAKFYDARLATVNAAVDLF